MIQINKKWLIKIAISKLVFTLALGSQGRSQDFLKGGSKFSRMHIQQINHQEKQFANIYFGCLTAYDYSHYLVKTVATSAL